MPALKKPQRETLTISRPALLIDGSDATFRGLIHDLMAYSHHIEACRDGFGAMIGLTGVQYEILMIVRRFGAADDTAGAGISVGQVAARLHRSGAFTTIETAKLAARGVIEKRADPTDRRKVLLKLTAAGEALSRTLAPYQQQVNDVLFECLDRRSFETLVTLARDLVDCGDRGAALSAFLVGQSTARVA